MWREKESNTVPENNIRIVDREEREGMMLTVEAGRPLGCGFRHIHKTWRFYPFYPSRSVFLSPDKAEGHNW